MKRTGMYLRKSRLDIENEKKTGVADTLANHRKDLLKYAKSHDLDIVDVYEEVVSGDSIIHRPEMIRLLQDVSDKKMDGVLVMDLDRLGRGDLQDQGLILNTFKRSNTLILTPDKVYDLNNEVDEDYAEFKSLVSRKEYKLITKRLKAGVRHFIEDGNYIPPIPPYGYKITRTDRTRSLEIIPEQAEVIKLIFDMFMEGTGINQIARDLNALGYKSYYGDAIERSWVSRVLRNPVYAGYIIWSRKEIRKSLDPNKKRTTRTREKDKHLITQGKHEAIISEELFYAVQDKLSEGHNAPVKKSQEIANPLAGLIKCKICGSSMVRVYNREINGKYTESLICKKFCGNRGITLHYVEDGLIEALTKWLTQYESEWYQFKEKKTNDQTQLYMKRLNAAHRERQGLYKQRDNLYNLVERGAYDIDTYIARSKVLTQEIEVSEELIKNIEAEFELYKQKVSVNYEIIPKMRGLLADYYNLNLKERNDALKSILNQAVFFKSKEWWGNKFELELSVKL